MRLTSAAQRKLFRTDLASDAAALSQAFSELVRVIQFRDRDRACCYGLTVSQCYGLKAVCEAGFLGVNDLAAALYLEKSTASRLAAALERASLVERSPDPEDGRSVRLSATAAGRQAYQAIEQDLLREHTDLLAGFDPEVRAAVTQVVGRLTRAMANRVEADGGSCCVVR
jgi:DNA-binding MarR family transcriptional regulator